MKIFYKVEVWADKNKYIVPIKGDDCALFLMDHFINDDDDDLKDNPRFNGADIFIHINYLDSFKIFAKVHGHDVETLP